MYIYICRLYIDDLHIKNHVQTKCQEIYHPSKVRDQNPSLNLMTAEQTFAWISRYKRIPCSMNKLHPYIE